MGLIKKLVVNSVLGLLVLWLVNTLEVMQAIGSTPMDYLWWPLILSALGGIPGALLAMVLHFVGIL